MTVPGSPIKPTEAGAALRCGACLGTGTMARYYQDGSFDPVDCDICHGFGYAVVDAHGQSRDPMGRFSGV